MAIPYRQQEEIKHRLERFFLIIAACYIALVVRLVYLQAVHGDYYRDRALKLRQERIVLTAQRGAILDRDGKPLAVTTHAGVLVCDPTLVRDPARTASTVAEILGLRPDDIRPYVSMRTLRTGQPARNVVVCERLDPTIVAAFRQAKVSKRQRADLAGLDIIDHPDRTYPTGRDAVHVVGLVMPGTGGQPRGVMGIEQSCDRQLKGVDGFVTTELDPRRRPIPDTLVARQEAVDGKDVRLTLDATIQHIAQEELAKCCLTFQPDSAAAIVLDPRTGDILAMVSYPDFDPLHRDQLRRATLPGMNRALTPFEPGSTLKILTAAAALQSGAITRSTTFYCGGRLKVGSRYINDAEHGKNGRNGHGPCDIEKTIAESCNICTAQIGMRLGMDRMKQCLRDFGMLDRTGIELSADQHGSLGRDPNGRRGNLYKVARVAFGHAVMVTPLAMVSAYAAIANGGLRVPPRLVLGVQEANNAKFRPYAPRPGRRVLSPELAAYLRELLQEVVRSGTAKDVADVPGYTVAGKTGTAQKVVPGRRGYSGQHIASFVGFLPAHNPRAVVYVMVDHPKGARYYGAQVAAPTFRAIAQQLMWYWKVPPDDPASLVRARTATRERRLPAERG